MLVEPLAMELSEAKRIAPKFNAVAEHRLADGTRVDLLSDQYAIEVDFPRKWAEAPGQALHYARHTGRRPGVVLLVSDPAKEMEHISNCAWLCGRLNIQLWLEPVSP